MDNLNRKQFRDWLEKYPVLSEEDFYPPEDNRILKSGIDDIDETYTYNDYVSDYFDMCDEEEIYD